MMKFKNLKVQDNSRKEIYDNDGKCYREKHTIKITNTQTNTSKYFPYTTEALQYIDRKNLLKNALYCIYREYEVINEFKDNLQEFINEFGYEEKEGKTIYNKMLKLHNRFSSLIDEELREELSKYYKEY